MVERLLSPENIQSTPVKEVGDYLTVRILDGSVELHLYGQWMT